MSGAAGAAQQAERSASSSALVTWLTASWLGDYSDCSAAVSTVRSCGDLVERNCHVVSNCPVAVNRQVVMNHFIVLNQTFRMLTRVIYA